MYSHPHSVLVLWTSTKYVLRSPNAPAVETLELVAETERAVEKEVEMFDCAIEGEGQGSWMDLVVAAP